MFYPITASGAADLEWLTAAPLAGVRALLAAHFFAIPQPMSRLRAFCDARRIALIEDCAHAFFGEFEGRALGSWGDFAIASLPKFFPVPEGGLIASDTRSLDALELAPSSWLDEIKAAANAVEVGAMHGRFPGLNTLLRGAFDMKNRLRGGAFDSSAPGGNPSSGLSVDARLNSARPVAVARWIAAGVRKSRIVANRRRNYAALAKHLSGIEGARALHPELPDGVAPYVFPLYVDDPAASYQPLRSSGIPIFRWDDIWPGTPVFKGDTGPDWAHRVFQIGCHQDLSPADIEAIAATVREVLRS